MCGTMLFDYQQSLQVTMATCQQMVQTLPTMLYHNHATTYLRKLNDPISPADANLHLDNKTHPHNETLLLAHPHMQCK